jgi:hypothetical protein
MQPLTLSAWEFNQLQQHKKARFGGLFYFKRADMPLKKAA